MAKLELGGYDELIKACNELAMFPESVVSDSLEAMGKVAAEKIKASGESYRIRDAKSSQHILDKIKVGKPKKTKSGGYANITFSGTRTRGTSRTSNSTIAFMNEYGQRSQQARPFVGTAMDKDADTIANAGLEVMSDWMDKTFEK